MGFYQYYKNINDIRFELRAEGLSLDQIRQRIKAEGFLRLAGMTCHTKSVLEKRLKSKFYGGYFDWNGIEYQGKHEPIIPKPIFDKVRTTFDPAFIPKPRNEEPLFSGMLRCAKPECGKQIVYDPKKKTIRTTGEVRTFKYYHCTNARRVHPSLAGMNVTEANLLDQYRRVADEVTITPAFAIAIKQALADTDAKSKAALRRQAQEFRDKGLHLERLEDTLYEHFCQGITTKDQYQRNIAKVRADRRRYEDLHFKTMEAINDAVLESCGRILELATSAELKWKAMSDVEKRDFAKTVLSNHLLDGSTVRYTLKNPFRVLVAMRGNEGWLTLVDDFRTAVAEWAMGA